MPFTSRTILTFLTTIILFVGTTKAQNNQTVDCNGLIVFNYNINSADKVPYFFRKTVVATLDCELIDHTMDATHENILKSLTNKEDVRLELRNKYEEYKKVMFLEYQKLTKKNEEGKNVEVTKVISQIRTWDGKYINDYEAEFYSKNINSNAVKEKREALINDFVIKAMNKDIYTPTKFSDLNKINVLVTNFKNPERDCPNAPATPEKDVEKHLQQTFDRNLVEVIIDNSEVDVTSSSEAILRGSENKADIVIWSSQYIDHCSQEDKAIIYYELLSNRKEDFLEPRNQTHLRGITSIYDNTLSKELSRIIFWKKGREAIEDSNWEKADDFISRLPDVILKNNEKAEKYFLLGSINFSADMNSDKFDKCQKNFRTCINNSDNNYFRMEWLQLLKLLSERGLDKQVQGKAKTEFQNQAEDLLESVDKDFPTNRDEFLFCLELAREMRISKHYVQSNLNRVTSFDSYQVLQSQIEYLDAIDKKGEAKKKATLMCDEYPQVPFGYEYLSKQYEKEEDVSSALQYALKAKALDNRNADQYIRLSDLYLKKAMLDSCRYYYLMGINLNPKLKKDNIENALGIIKNRTPKQKKKVVPFAKTKESITYTVRNGNQSFRNILNWFEREFGEDMRRKVQNLNAYNDKDIISVDTRLVISDGIGEVTYEVKSGDNLSNIAIKCKQKIDNPPEIITVESLMSLNGIPGTLSKPEICPGQILIVVEGKGTGKKTVSFPNYKDIDEVVAIKGIDRNLLLQLNGDSKCGKKRWIVKE